MAMSRPHGLVLLAFGVLLSGCIPSTTQVRSSALEFLYPKGSPAIPATDVSLTVPTRVAIAFPPENGLSPGSFTEDRKQQLLERIKAAFAGRKNIAGVEVVPSTYLSPEGGFDNLDRVATAFGADVVALVSYDQVQFSDSGAASIAYWTIVGAYVVKGEKNETRTMLDATVFHVQSRAMLFNASGRSSVRGSSTPMGTGKALRSTSDQGFLEATDELIAHLETALTAFEEQATSGTVRGPGTPALALVNAEGQPIDSSGTGGGAVGAAEVGLALLLLLACRRAA
jgi:rhombotail lipoprotein